MFLEILLNRSSIIDSNCSLFAVGAFFINKLIIGSIILSIQSIPIRPIAKDIISRPKIESTISTIGSLKRVFHPRPNLVIKKIEINAKIISKIAFLFGVKLIITF
tara:strand:+ start:357 stop:671 length:315 start_codon:yes stop_codon:yes gene_type:complete